MILIISEVYIYLSINRWNGVSVDLVWIPGHVGIAGDKSSDSLAKQAVAFSRVSDAAAHAALIAFTSPILE